MDPLHFNLLRRYYQRSHNPLLYINLRSFNLSLYSNRRSLKSLPYSNQRSLNSLHYSNLPSFSFTVPCVFALLPNKLKRSYRRLFNQIRNWIDVAHQHWNFDVFLSDFEQGAFTAVAEVFPGVGNDGCFFHLSKRLDYHVKQLGLTRKYTADASFRLRVKKLAALAFVCVRLNPYFREPVHHISC